jgi:putative transport protein
MLALLQNPLLLLFVVAAIGYLVGKVQIRGVGLGVAAVLFAGLAIGAIDPSLKLPTIIQQLGLVIFVYTVGIASGPGFFAAFRRRGLRDNGLALGALSLGAALVLAAQSILHLRPGVAVGVFTGALTNTPALAGAVEWLHRTGASEAALADPVVGYSVTYPMGVLGVLAALSVARKLRVDDEPPPDSRMAPAPIVDVTILVTRDEATRAPAADLLEKEGIRALLGRHEHAGAMTIVPPGLVLAKGDRVSVVGTARHVARATALFGEESRDRLDLDRSVFDYRRIFVSSRDVAGRKLAEIALAERFGATITRLRRGDVELVPDRDTVLELGDRVRVVAPRERLGDISKYLGDSYSAVSEVDVVTFAFGIALGLLLGSVPIPTFVGPPLELGLAGGPLIVGLVLGRLERTGPLVWALPFSANMTLRQLGLVLFLAGVGTGSGWAFVQTMKQGGGLAMLLAGAVVTFTVALTIVVIGRKVLKIPLSTLSGMLAGIHTQPAVLAVANEQSKDGAPSVGYATVFPIATIGKIVIAQVIIMLLSR